MCEPEIGLIQTEEEIYIDNLKVADPTDERNYACDGILIRFPYSAYESQKEMMREIIAGVKNSQNCLLESPTGTGKTASLLCSLLAWQQEFIREANATTKNEENPSTFSSSSSTPRKNPTQHISIQYEMVEKPVKNQKAPEEPEILMPKNKSPDKTNGSGSKGPASTAPPTVPVRIPVIYYATRTHTQIKSVVAQLKKTAYSHIPMTILASREQCCVNEEARKSENGEKVTGDMINKFCESQRKDAVIENEKIKEKSTSKNEPLIKSTCPYYQTEDQADFNLLIRKNKMAALDIEDLVTFGKQYKKCPYYGTKELQKSARIIFCTYNHLLQRSVRSASRIGFENSVFVFDEAHNIESFCLSEGTIEISQQRVEEVRLVLDKASTIENVPTIKQGPLQTLTVAFTHLSKWFRGRGHETEQSLFSLDDNDGTWGKGKGVKERWARDLNGANFAIFEKVNQNSSSPVKRPRLDQIDTSNTNINQGPNDLTSFPKMMKEALFGPSDLRDLWSAYFFMGDCHFRSNKTKEELSFKIDEKAYKTIGSFLSTLQYLFKTETAQEIPGPSNQLQIQNQNQNPYFFPRLRDYKIELIKEISRDNKESLKLLLLCMNPALVFEKIQKCRSVIVTSGTLSPLDSFSSELNTPFQRRLSARHVIGRDRVLVNVIKNVCSERLLELTKSKLDGPLGNLMRDDLGQIILSICENVANGILVFVTSKVMCRALHSHFKESGVLKKLEKVKGKVFWETDTDANTETEIRNNQSSIPMSMQEMISKYVEEAKTPRGALLFAVCRGRVSEGVDFSDEQARGVITLGIPFLPPFDKKIMAKKTYNERRFKAKKDCLNQQDWYESSAFRAQNQTFGRCIRHSKDWGVISIVDSRTMQNRRNLSRWVSQEIRRDQGDSLSGVLPKIQQFIQHRLASDQ